MESNKSLEVHFRPMRMHYISKLSTGRMKGKAETHHATAPKSESVKVKENRTFVTRSDALVPSSILLLLVRHLLLLAMHLLLLGWSQRK